MSDEEAEWTIAHLREQVEELQQRVEDLEMRANRPHNCSIDLCSFDDSGECRYSPERRWDE